MKTYRSYWRWKLFDYLIGLSLVVVAFLEVFKVIKLEMSDIGFIACLALAKSIYADYSCDTSKAGL